MRMAVADPTPEAVVARLAPYAATFHACLAEAVARARAVFRPAPGVHRVHDPWLFAHHVRWELKQLLTERLPAGTPVAVEESTIMSSVVVHLDDLEIRVRKSEPGEVPPPGASERMIGWYAQTLDGSVSHNVLLLWHVDARLHYAGLDVAFPAGGNAYAPLVRWVVPLPETIGAADDLAIGMPSGTGEERPAAGDRAP